ncbi:MAG: hypothetical protein NC452_08555 [Eubacterium sp.]|nr:hypothetical protein [Eubacterium sp.]
MSKKVKFPLDMGNDIMVRTVEELRENYNAEKVTEYFLGGKLLTWLEDRYYDEEAEQVRAIAGQKGNPAAKLAKIFGVEFEEEVDVEALEIRRVKLERLRAVTSDDEILDNVDFVAFSQEDLGDLLDDGAEVIYLCGESFRIPLSVKNVRYVGVNNPTISISGNGDIDLEANGIVIENCRLPKEIEEKISTPKIDSEYKIRLYVPKQTQTLKDNNTVLAAEYGDELLYINFCLYRYRVLTDEFCVYQILGNHEINKIKSSHDSIDTTILNYDRIFNEILSKTEVYVTGNSAFEMYKMQMLEALDNLPQKFDRKDGAVDKTDRETIAAVEEAVRLFIGYNCLNANKGAKVISKIQYLEDEEEPYD